MIVGGHVMIQSRNEAADKAFFRDVLKLPHVDAGGGFLLFALPPSEFAIHEADANDAHELYLMCENMADFLEAMEEVGVAFSEPTNRGWGTMTSLVLPGGGKLGVYQPHHARPHKVAKAATAKRAKVKKRVAKKVAKKAAKPVAKKAGKKKRARR
jgi:hypothetical protein